MTTNIIKYNNREFPVLRTRFTCTDYRDIVCSSVSGIKLQFRAWHDGLVECKGIAK